MLRLARRIARSIPSLSAIADNPRVLRRFALLGFSLSLTVLTLLMPNQASTWLALLNLAILGFVVEAVVNIQKGREQLESSTRAVLKEIGRITEKIEGPCATGYEAIMHRATSSLLSIGPGGAEVHVYKGYPHDKEVEGLYFETTCREILRGSITQYNRIMTVRNEIERQAVEDVLTRLSNLPAAKRRNIDLLIDASPAASYISFLVVGDESHIAFPRLKGENEDGHRCSLHSMSPSLARNLVGIYESIKARGQFGTVIRIYIPGPEKDDPEGWASVRENMNKALALSEGSSSAR